MSAMGQQTRISRRLALGSALATAAGAASARPPEAERRATAEAALQAFLKAFENDDLPTMSAAFAPDAVSFDPVVASPHGTPDLDLAALRRRPGMPPAMRALVERSRQTGGSPPYRDLTPRDLLIQVEGPVALCTFHLETATSLARRTIVLVERGGVWKILHIHASNAVTV